MQKLLETSKLLEILDYDETAIPQKFKITNIINDKLIITNDKEFFSLLNKLRFYMIEQLPHEIYDYIFVITDQTHKQNLQTKLQNDFKDFFLSEFLILTNTSKSIYFHSGYIDETFRYIRDDKTHNYFNLLEYLILKGCTCKWYSSCHDCVLNQQNIKVSDDCFQFMIDLYVNGAFNTHHQAEVIRMCAKYGNLELIKYIHNNWCSKNECIDTTKCNHTAWHTDIGASAAKRGHLECLKYIHEHGYYWTDLTTHHAMIGSSLECLKYAIENGCGTPSNILYNCSDIKPLYNDLDYTTKYKPDKLGCIKYLLSKNICDVNDVMVCANAANNFEILRFLHNSGFAWHYRTALHAAECNNLKCLKYAHENGCSLNSACVTCAASSGALECLKYLYENGCKGNTHSMYEACRRKNFDCLKYLHEMGCPWSINTYNIAMYDRYYEILEYLDKHNCPKPNTCIRCYTQFDSKIALSRHLLSKKVCKETLIKISRDDAIKKFNL